jgi:hypothetical protein
VACESPAPYVSSIGGKRNRTGAAKAKQGDYVDHLREVKRKIAHILSRLTGTYDARCYWDQRYRSGEDSGSGSREFNWQFKTDYINSIIKKYSVRSVVDFGCGDGMQIRDLQVREYLELDISPVALAMCRKLYADRPK